MPSPTFVRGLLKKIFFMLLGFFLFILSTFLRMFGVGYVTQITLKYNRKLLWTVGNGVRHSTTVPKFLREASLQPDLALKSALTNRNGTSQVLNRRVASQFFLVSPDSQVAEALVDPLACLRRGEVLNEK